MQKPEKPWSLMNGGEKPTSQRSNLPKSSASQANIELSRTNFGDRNTRHNGFGTTQPAPKSHASSAAPSSKRSEIRSGGFQKLGATLAK